LRQALFLKLRDEWSHEQLRPEIVSQHPDYQTARGAAGRLHLRRKDPRFWPAVGVVLDILQARSARVQEAAADLGISTANLVAFLQTDPKVWEQAQQMRARFGQKPLRND
jgi:hypothetical protein